MKWLRFGRSAVEIEPTAQEPTVLVDDWVIRQHEVTIATLWWALWHVANAAGGTVHISVRDGTRLTGGRAVELVHDPANDQITVRTLTRQLTAPADPRG